MAHARVTISAFFSLALTACVGPTYVVQQYPGEVRAPETISILRVNGKDNVRIASLDGANIAAPIASDSRLHIEMLPARHTLAVVDANDQAGRLADLAFEGEAGKVYRVIYTPSHEPHVYEVDRGSDAPLTDVTKPTDAPDPPLPPLPPEKLPPPEP